MSEADLERQRAIDYWAGVARKNREALRNPEPPPPDHRARDPVYNRLVSIEPKMTVGQGTLLPWNQ